MEDRTNAARTDESQTPLDTLFSALADADRRRVLARLREAEGEPASTTTLASALAAPTQELPPEEETTDQRRRALRQLRHVHLPVLSEAGLVEHDDGDDEVALADHRAFRDPSICAAIDGDGPGEVEALDALFAALADAGRRTALDVLSHQFGRIHLETLARELCARNLDTTESAVPSTEADRRASRLYHADLPQLAAAGLVDYDADDRTVAYQGHPALRVPWMHSELIPSFRQSLTGESEPSGVGEIAGREAVVSFGQSLCEGAEDELFCLFTDTDLLEAGCLTRIKDAADRGVDVSLGTPDPTVRQYVRENAPEVTLWEPSTDWLNLPVADDRVGRLVLADREAAMLGTLGPRAAGDLPEEQAMVGERADNTLVVVLCQLLRPHLDAIDDESEELATHLPR